MKRNGTLTELDHIVFASRDIEADARWFLERFGVHAVAGGSHPGNGTRNSLLGLDGKRVYLELIYPDPGQKHAGTKAEPMTRLKKSGVYHWAVRHPDLESVHATALQRGIASSGVRRMSRKTESGTLLEWKLLFCGGHGFGALVPFFIDWGDSPHPADTLPSIGAVASITLMTPRTESLRDLLRAFDVDAEIKKADAPAIATSIRSKGRGRGETIALPVADPLTDGLAVGVC